MPPTVRDRPNLKICRLSRPTARAVWVGAISLLLAGIWGAVSPENLWGQTGAPAQARPGTGPAGRGQWPRLETCWLLVVARRVRRPSQCQWERCKDVANGVATCAGRAARAGRGARERRTRSALGRCSGRRAGD